MENNEKMKKKILIIGAVLGGVAVGIGLGIENTSKALRKEMKEKQNLSQKHLDMFFLMNEWVKIKQEGKHLQDYFIKNGYNSIAIYGMSYVGERLFDELKESDISIKYGIDKKKDNFYSDIDIVTPDSKLEQIDAIVVTPIYYFDEIKEELLTKVECPIVSIEDILYDL